MGWIPRHWTSTKIVAEIDRACPSVIHSAVVQPYTIISTINHHLALVLVVLGLFAASFLLFSSRQQSHHGYQSIGDESTTEGAKALEGVLKAKKQNKKLSFSEKLATTYRYFPQTASTTGSTIDSNIGETEMINLGPISA
jgi:hypothetical protein